MPVKVTAPLAVTSNTSLLVLLAAIPVTATPLPAIVMGLLMTSGVARVIDGKVAKVIVASIVGSVVTALLAAATASRSVHVPGFAGAQARTLPVAGSAVLFTVYVTVKAKACAAGSATSASASRCAAISKPE